MNNQQRIKISQPRALSFSCPPGYKSTKHCSRAFPDLTKYNDRLYLAFRTAPSHYPSKRAAIQLFSSQDGKDWRPEQSITIGQDLRDPHFLQFKGKLFLFFIRHSNGIIHHEPEEILYVQKMDNGWSTPTALPIQKAGFWNIKAYKGTVYMSIYTHNGNDHKRKKRHFRMVASKDMKNWKPVFDSPITRERLSNYQTSESSFDFDREGNIIGTIRSLIYPNLNFRIPAVQPNAWKIQVDRFKCDGPKLFRLYGSYYLTARRSYFYRLRNEPYRFLNRIRNLINIIRYSFSRKRTAIYRYDPDRLAISHIADLPSHGDTGYSAIAPLSDKSNLLIYYSSELSNGKDYHWIQGQIRPTNLYACVISTE